MAQDISRQLLDIVLTLYGPLLLGYLLHKLGLLGTAWTRPCMMWLVVLIEPPIVMYSIWALRTEDIAVGGSLLGGIAGVILAAWLIATAMIFISRLVSEPFRHNPRTRGAFIASAVFSNVGFTFGVFVCLLFLGLRGQSIGLVYGSSFMPFIVTVGFAIGRHYGRTARVPFKHQVLSVFTEPISALPLAGFVLGIILHQLAPPPPQSVVPINRAAVHVEVAIYAFAIGCSLSLRKVRRYWKECAACCGLKFLVMPVIGLGVLFLLRSFGILNTEPIIDRAFLIQTAMPVAIMSIVIAKLFNLNEDLANSCWVITTVATLAVLPVLSWLVT